MKGQLSEFCEWWQEMFWKISSVDGCIDVDTIGKLQERFEATSNIYKCWHNRQTSGMFGGYLKYVKKNVTNWCRRVGQKALHLSMKESRNLPGNWCEIILVLCFHLVLLPLVLPLPDAVLVELLRFDTDPHLQFNNKDLAVRKTTFMKQIIHVWEQEEITQCRSLWVWWVRHDFIPALLSKSHRAYDIPRLFAFHFCL